MCGIAGIIGIDLEKDRSESSCQSMLRAIRHRGPDASGIFHDHPGQAHLVHARLSIIDLSERANQPLHRHNRYSIVFNGEIYNFRALRKKLESDGVCFETDSDTEVILALYENEGPESFSQLRGMFAFAIWDRKERTCVLARDPFGIKPLYYAKKEDGLTFASEVKALVASGLINPELSPEGVASYLRLGSVDQEKGLLQGIESLSPGFYLKLSASKCLFSRFQTVAWESPSRGMEVPDFREAFLESVSAHLVSDVPVGIFLSGGLDSSSVLAACRILGKTNLKLFTLSFPGTTNDEGPATKKVADYFDSPLVSGIPGDEDLGSLFESFLENQDLPSIDGFNTYCVSRLARTHGIKVVLSGLGGDELLGGYPSFQRIPTWTSIGRFVSRLPGGKGIARGMGLFPGNKAARFSEFLAGPASATHAYVTCRTLFSLKETDRILSAWHMGRVIGENSFDQEAESLSSPYQISKWESTIYMRNQLLRDSDACSMRHGIELRVPFVDVPLWNCCAGLPAQLRYEKGKRLLQRALPELPPWLFSLPKKGFSLPYDQWRQQELQKFFNRFPGQQFGYPPTWYQEMALLSLGAWRKSLNI